MYSRSNSRTIGLDHHIILSGMKCPWKEFALTIVCIWASLRIILESMSPKVRWMSLKRPFIIFIVVLQTPLRLEWWLWLCNNSYIKGIDVDGPFISNEALFSLSVRSVRDNRLEAVVWGCMVSPLFFSFFLKPNPKWPPSLRVSHKEHLLKAVLSFLCLGCTLDSCLSEDATQTCI